MNILVTGADRGLGFGITKLLLERGETVYAGRYISEWKELDGLLEQYPNNLFIIPLDVGSDESVANAAATIEEIAGHIDILISNAGISGTRDDAGDETTDTQMMLDVYNVNSVGAVRLIERLRHLLEKSTVRKLCFVSSEAGSITQCWRDGFFWYCMSKAALNMYIKVMHNKLHGKGYRFRLYHPGWVKSYMSGKLNDNATYSIDEAAAMAVDYFIDKEVDEDKLIMRGYDGEEFDF